MLRALLTGLGLVTAAACQRTAAPREVPPDAEFLLAAGDSTYWVTSGARGVRVRSAPILLTQVDGQLYEVFLADEPVDFEDAAFTRTRLFARNVTQRDSVLLFADSTVAQEAAAWRRRHPTAPQINPEDEEPSQPHTVVSEDIEIHDVHGPYVTITHLLDVDVADRPSHRHVGHTYVLDVRSGRRMTLADLVGTAPAARVEADARRRFAQLTDSIRAATDERAAAARATLSSFRFDPNSVGLTDSAGVLAVSYMVPGTGLDGSALSLNVPIITVAAPSWWPAVAATLPVWSSDSSRIRWQRAGYTVVAGLAPDGASIQVTLERVVARSAAASAGRSWPVATMPTPVYQLIPLDAPALPAAQRTGLARAFDAASTQDGVAQAVAWHAPLRPRPHTVHRLLPRPGA